MGNMVNGSSDGTAEVLEDGGAEVTARGLCLSTKGEPTVFDQIISVGSGIGLFTGTMSGLAEGPTYYIRAYATNSTGTAYSEEILSFKICPSEFEVIHTAGLNGAPETKTVTYHSVSTKISGAPRCWLTQNLGADREALSATDASTESAGWYWQFNRKQGYKHDGTTRTPNLAYVNWVSSIHENTSWASYNDPCILLLGSGWRLPTRAEWAAADGVPQNWSNIEETYKSVLKLHAGGYLYYSNGALTGRGTTGYLWSSNNYSYDYGYYYNTNGSAMTYLSKAYAFPVRCIRDTIVVSLPVVSNVEIPASKMTSTTAECTAIIATDGGAEVTARGYCWSTKGTPTLEDNVLSNGIGVGSFTSIMDKIEEGPTYYVRAYATNKKGTAYSPETTTFKICPTAFKVIHTEGLNGAPETKTVTYHSASTFISGQARCWLTQNLGADQQATSASDASTESAGWYWQFNRKQGYKHDGKTRTPNLAYVPWISSIHENNSWLAQNDPCRLLLGSGWRLPTSAEWAAADAPPQNWGSQADTYNSVLQLHAAGYLNYSSGALVGRGTTGYYWSSTNYTYDNGYYYNTNGSAISYKGKAYAFPVRCLRDKIEYLLPTVSNVNIPTTGMTTTSATGTATVATDGGAEVTARGLCWNTTGNPTIENDNSIIGSGTGDFTSIINNLEEGPTYYVRAYATNKVGTAYSPQVTTFKVCPTEFDVIHTVGLNGAPETKTVKYHSISSSITGEARCWLTQNLGADRQALSSNDNTESSAGWYWQFNRSQGYKHDGTTRTPNLAYVPWINGIHENNSWLAKNDPCCLLLGSGWRLPTRVEWEAADAPPQNWGSQAQTYASVLKLHAAGYLHYSVGALTGRGTEGRYWSSTNNTYDYGYYYNSNGSVITNISKAYGFNIRCIRDNIVVVLPTVSDVDIPTSTMTTITAKGTATIATNGGAKVSERGLCWNTTGKPTIDDNKIVVGYGTGIFSATLQNLKEGPTYYVRAYAINSAGTAYSPKVTTFKICPTEFTVIHTEGLNGAPETKTVTYHSISTDVTGEARCWLTQNLGASQQPAALNDASGASAGWYWQFNRKQGYKHDGTTRTPNLAYVNWTTSIHENTAWASYNDPCRLLLGSGWRLPVLTEWQAADAPPQNWGSQADTYNSVLKLHSAGYLNYSNGALIGRGTTGFYWSSTNNTYDYGYYYNTNGSTITYKSKAYAFPVRCIRDAVELLVPSVSNVSIPTSTMTGTSAQCSATVTPDGGAEVTTRGFCWNTTATPSVGDNIIPVGSGIGVITATMTGLSEGPTYYVRAYATNSTGTTYSPEVSSFKICPTTFSVTHTAGVDGAVETKAVTYHSITSTISGAAKCWLTQNLGADRQASSATDASETAAGWYWQFNRKQAYKHNGTIRTPSNGWVTSIHENCAWYAQNDPCRLLLGNGWRLPTSAEWVKADAPPQYWTSAAHTYASVLKLHAAGYLHYSVGALTGRGTEGRYWSSNNYYYDHGYYYDSNGSPVTYISKRYGFSARCIKD